MASAFWGRVELHFQRSTCFHAFGNEKAVVCPYDWRQQCHSIAWTGAGPVDFVYSLIVDGFNLSIDRCSLYRWRNALLSKGQCETLCRFISEWEAVMIILKVTWFVMLGLPKQLKSVNQFVTLESGHELVHVTFRSIQASVYRCNHIFTVKTNQCHHRCDNECCFWLGWHYNTDSLI